MILSCTWATKASLNLKSFARSIRFLCVCKFKLILAVFFFFNQNPNCSFKHKFRLTKISSVFISKLYFQNLPSCNIVTLPILNFCRERKMSIYHLIISIQAVKWSSVKEVFS